MPLVLDYDCIYPGLVIVVIFSDHWILLLQSQSLHGFTSRGDELIGWIKKIKEKYSVATMSYFSY